MLVGRRAVAALTSPVTMAAGEEAPMASKNKGGKNTKQAAGRSLKEKRQAKREKKSAKAKLTVGT